MKRQKRGVEKEKEEEWKRWEEFGARARQDQEQEQEQGADKKYFCIVFEKMEAFARSYAMDDLEEEGKKTRYVQFSHSSNCDQVHSTGQLHINSCIMHCDIKPENIMSDTKPEDILDDQKTTNFSAKLSDFGSAIEQEECAEETYTIDD